MKKKFFTATGIVLIVILLALWAHGRVRAANEFSDIQNSPYQASIRYLVQKGIVQGYADGTFRPHQPINRAETLKLLFESNLIPQDLEPVNDCFKDVGGEWFSYYVCAAKQKGIIKGYPDGFFRPGQTVNKVEALKMSIEAFGGQLNAPKEQGEWYQPYIDFSHDYNLFSRYSFLPNSATTRGEMSFLVHQFLLEKSGEKKLTKGHSNLSAGCGMPAPGKTPTQSVVNGVNRDYITVIPKGYSPTKPVKLIFAFHGRTNSNAMVQGYYGIDKASQNEAIIVYPAGLPTGQSSRGWSDPGDPANDLRDYALFDQLLAEFSNNYCVDLDEVYVVAHSLGAWFANSLACFRGNVIRGVGTLGGGTSVGECTGPVAAMIWHNPKDRLVPFSQGETARNQYLRQNQCSSQSTPVEPQSGNCVEYQGCYQEAPVVWCPHNVDTDNRGTYYPHTWPKFTGSEIWKFFKSL
ncbi:S-layer homology domain-containing protein [Candidatus Peregrinibacteria bacterium]|nr:MAG: S-layer homology domain-containing protein [Candidatus Peregrinibacteria bacterium]